MTPERVTATGSLLGAVVALVGGLTASQIAAFGGLAIALLMGAANIGITIYFKRQHYLLVKSITERNTIMSLPTEDICEVCPIKNEKLQ